ncbi:hypothetical protein GYMLUDRAFT_252536 [Collybiopsis luxurians FD-317 M1]|uniref:Uncharacterized protein n=1 Tax=Collybiopsis luxurians FD-317 M1 TaxID=944289 RepID=A0A0D0C827_9AGAR|nr:hypothetical protein GYMLUDRAFT_252536 [Collybiopsis luxurians FD-317 M1]
MRLNCMGPNGTSVIERSVIVVLNGPSEASIGQIKEFKRLFIAPGFLAYTSVLIAVSLAIIFYFAPHHGTKSMLWYIFICSMIGGISVSVMTVLGSAIVTTTQGDNQFKYWFIYFLMRFMAIMLITKVYYLYVALGLFNMAMGYIHFFLYLNDHRLKASASSIITLVMGFIVICFGITILHMSEASCEHTEGFDEQDILVVKDPGIDTLSSFGTGAMAPYDPP